MESLPQPAEHSLLQQLPTTLPVLVLMIGSFPIGCPLVWFHASREGTQAGLLNLPFQVRVLGEVLLSTYGSSSEFVPH